MRPFRLLFNLGCILLINILLYTRCGVAVQGTLQNTLSQNSALLFEVVFPDLSSSTMSQPQQDRRWMGAEWQWVQNIFFLKMVGYTLNPLDKLRFES